MIFSSAMKVKYVQWQSFARKNFRPTPATGHISDTRHISFTKRMRIREVNPPFG